ncbi:MAG: dTMP kinase [Acidimicrobiia bacterium]
MMEGQARFVVVEGGDGSGKTTQVGRLADALRARGHVVCTTFEPGATAAGAVLRDVLLHGRDPVSSVAEALLMAADRAQHVAEVVAPALARGEWVVSDRFLASSLVYQGVVRGLGVEVIRGMNEAATAGVRPDLVVVLDVPESQARARRDGTPDRLEAEEGTFHAQVAAAYRDLAPSEGWVLVDGTGAPDAVAERVVAVVDARLAP